MICLKDKLLRINLMKVLDDKIHDYFQKFDETKEFFKLKDISNKTIVYELLNTHSDEQIALETEFDISPISSFRQNFDNEI
jgi:hypothetical protein